MKTIIFKDFLGVKRADLLTFSKTYRRMIAELQANKNDSIELRLGRITDTGINISDLKRFSVERREESMLHVTYNDPQYEDTQHKTIRFDNVFGEIPILPGYENMPKFFRVGEEFATYQQFIQEVKDVLLPRIGNSVSLIYKNDDNSLSVIEGVLKEVNKGNIFMQDYRETKIFDEKTVSVNIGFERNKNHRFISENGFLFRVSGPIFGKLPAIDTGEEFGNEKSWKFLFQSA